MNKQLLEILVCPVTKAKLVQKGEELWCRASALAYPIRNDIPVMLESEARSLSQEEVESIKT
ncbi:MAG: Trm112 family protein [Pseudomonadota bacterium]